jgi:hypothetical protein
MTPDGLKRCLSIDLGERGGEIRRSQAGSGGTAAWRRQGVRRDGGVAARDVAGAGRGAAGLQVVRAALPLQRLHVRRYGRPRPRDRVGHAE